MSFLPDISFLYPWVLILLLAIPLLAWWHLEKRGPFLPAFRLSRAGSMPEGHSLRSHLANALPWVRLLVLGLLIVALARPREVDARQDVEADAISIALVMDLSSSMLAQDFQPNRLEVSKQVAINFVKNRPYDKIGLAVFAGEAFTQCPLTTDHLVVQNFLQDLRTGTLEDGTAIGEGLAIAVNRLKESQTKTRVAILLTDGVNNAGYIQPATAAEIAREFGIKVYTIGVGSSGRAYAPISRRGNGGYRFGLKLVEIDEELLREIARQTGGRYYRATSAASLQEIYAEIDRLEKTRINVNIVREYSERFHWLVIAALLLIFLELLLRYYFLNIYP